jgi:PAS domain S-box-containing protein
MQASRSTNDVGTSTNVVGTDFPAKGIGQALKDPAALLQKVISTKNEEKIVEQLATYLNGRGYSIVDLFHDAAGLKKKIASDGRPLDRLIQGWTLVDRTVRDCLALTSIPHEKFIESTGHAFCELDNAGTVVFANAKMLELDPKCVGQKLASRFGKFAPEVRRQLTGEPPVKTGLIYQCEFTTERGRWPVLAEFGRIDTPAGRRGYALLVDMTEIIGAELKALEAAPYGMLKLDAAHRILYANQKMLELFELPHEELLGRDVTEFVTDETSRQEVLRQAADRQKGIGSQYTIVFTKPRSKTQIHLRITGVPLFDASGAFNGMLTSAQPIDHELARQEIARLVATQTDFKVLFQSIMGVVSRFVQFDRGAVLSMFTAEQDYSREICRYKDKGPAYQSRWFALPESMRQWIDQPRTWTDDVQAWLEAMPDRGDILNSPDTRAALADGLKSLICLPVRVAGSTVGALALRSKQPGLYGEETKKILQDRLALDQALYAVFSARARAERDFIAALGHKISASTPDHRDLAKTVCREIAEFYDFQSVSIFKVNALRGYFSILAQAKGRTSQLGLPDDYTQPLDQGVLGLAYRRGANVIVKDAGAKDASEEARAFIRVAPETMSELCVPIKLRERILWILNLEDSHVNAFAKPEVETIEGITQQLGAIIERGYQVLVLEQMIEVFPEAIVVTEARGNILTTNKSALRMLGRTASSPGDNLADFLPAVDRPRLLSGIAQSRVPTTVLGKDGRETPVLLSSFTLPEEYDHRIVILEDVAELRWKTDLERLKAALAEAATQVRVPLSLVSSFVQQIGTTVTDKNMQELVRKTVRQLGRIELTYDRVLASYDAGKLPPERRVPIEVGRIVQHVVSELPKMAGDSVKTTVQSGQMVVLADTYRLLFALESMIAYLLRSRSSSETISIAVRRVDGFAEVAMSGPVQQASQLGEFARVVEATRTAIALGEEVLQQIIAAWGGKFKRRQTGQLESLSIRLPLSS